MVGEMGEKKWNEVMVQIVGVDEIPKVADAVETNVSFKTIFFLQGVFRLFIYKCLANLDFYFSTSQLQSVSTLQRGEVVVMVTAVTSFTHRPVGDIKRWKYFTDALSDCYDDSFAHVTLVDRSFYNF